MTTATDSNGNDSGLEALVTLLHFQGVAADREQIRHRFGTNKIGASEILRCAKDFGLKARACQHQMVAACQNAIAGDRKPAGRPVHGGRQSQ